ncbi:hypothetical protein A7Q10_00580 [Methylacidiphilum caldifontis]|uniref:Sulfotransferase domain-containing protein n=2 Tax=Methylacidiphilum caldifontis TaxID=2795386 RepID=A0A4Y8PB09_9BACT|nr:hypothetical protein A7Q10_00580 [Methylacidiphilum caldifontis]
MHRSGTSLLGNILHTLGIPFGKNLIGANEHNKKGYWEDQEIVAIQDGLLIQLGLDWWKENSVDPYPKDFFLSPPLLNAQQKLKEVLSQRMEENGGVFGFKDPRTSRFLPIYRKI